jgi:hypothetical protein
MCAGVSQDPSRVLAVQGRYMLLGGWHGSVGRVTKSERRNDFAAFNLWLPMSLGERHGEYACCASCGSARMGIR